MTQTELDALPVSGGIGYRQKIIDGQRVRIPYMDNALVLFDPVLVVDERGERWMVGTANGIRYKSPMGMFYGD